MAQSRRPRDLNTPVTRFPKRLYQSLRAFLDKEDATAERDWRLLVVKLKLCESDVEIVQKSEEKTRVALELWEQQVGPDEGNGYGLVRILRDMKRFDVVKEVERFLGIANPTSDKLKMDFRVIDEAARQGDNKTLKKVIGDKTVNYLPYSDGHVRSAIDCVLCRESKWMRNLTVCLSHPYIQLSTTVTIPPFSFSSRKVLMSIGK